MSKIFKKSPDKNWKSVGHNKNYLSRITKTLYYGKLPKTDALSLPVTELAAELFSEVKKGKSLERLHYDEAAEISRNVCISPCSLVLAMLYLERLKKCNPEYLDKTAPSDLFLVSLMVSCKFLFDDGESDEVFFDEWALSGGISEKELVLLEKDFLKAIDWEIYVSELHFWKKLNEIETTLAAKQGALRGYFTYTELQKLAGTVEIQNLIHCVVAISIILVTAYIAGLLTIVSSIYLTSHVPGTSLHAQRSHNQDTSIALPLNDINLVEEPYVETEIKSKHGRNIDAVDVLKTSILLASIKTNSSNHTNETDIILGTNDNKAQYISWDYWNVPIMEWLAKSSQFVSSFAIELPFKYYTYFLETSISNSKCFELEDSINKATKTRIQDQLESSWHKEWTDTFIHDFIFEKIFPCHLQTIKS